MTQPAVQLMQSLMLVLVKFGWYVPLGHNLGSLLVPSQYAPGGQGICLGLAEPTGQ